MKKLLILTAVVLLAGAAGCKSCDKWFRGAPDCPPPAPVMSTPCYDPCSSPCGSPCGVPAGAVMAPGGMPVGAGP